MPEHEVGQAVSGELSVEGEISGHLERVDEVIGDAHGFSAELEPVSALDFRHHFADGEIAAVELAEMIGADAETTGDRQRKLRRRFDARILRAVGHHAGRRSGLPR